MNKKLIAACTKLAKNGKTLGAVLTAGATIAGAVVSIAEAFAPEKEDEK